MSNYKGLFTFDEDSHKYVPIPIAGAEGIIDAIGRKPAEPLIKDEKIRKAVRAWAELHGLESVFYFAYTIHKELSYLKSKDTGVVIDIVALSELEDGEIYTIAELCGEKEE